jgi:hypothetical protein
LGSHTPAGDRSHRSRCDGNARMTGVRVLVVEDEMVIADALIAGLRGDGYVVEHTARGDDG